MLEARCRAPPTAQRDVKPARIVLLAAEGRSTRSIAEEVGVQPRIVSHWRRRALLASAANVLVCSKCKRCSSYKAIEQTLFGCRILKFNVAPFRTMACQNRFPVEYSVSQPNRRPDAHRSPARVPEVRPGSWFRSPPPRDWHEQQRTRVKHPRRVKQSGGPKNEALAEATSSYSEQSIGRVHQLHARPLRGKSPRPQGMGWSPGLRMA